LDIQDDVEYLTLCFTLLQILQLFFLEGYYFETLNLSIIHCIGCGAGFYSHAAHSSTNHQPRQAGCQR
jgi:hypothetical protein